MSIIENIVWSVLGVGIYFIIGFIVSDGYLDVPRGFKDYLKKAEVFFFWPYVLAYYGIFGRN